MPELSASERERECYEQNFEQFRSLNQIMWQVPVIAMTLTGGLWFGAANVGRMPGFQYLLLLLAAIANIGLIFILTRVRYVMDGYLEAIKAFHPAGFVEARGTRVKAPRSVATTFRVLLFLSAVISVVAMAIVYRSNAAEPQTRRVIEVIEVTK